VYSAHITALLFDLLDATQLAQGCISGFLRRHAFCDLLLNQFSQVEAELVGQLLLDASPTEERPKPKGQVVEPAHRDLPDPLPAGPSLLVPQRDDRIDLCRAPRRNATGEQRCADQYEWNRKKSEWISGSHTV